MRRHKGRLVHFYKRAQILVADLWAAFGCQTADNGHFASFVDVGKLTMFADYRVPQILRHVGVRAKTWLFFFSCMHDKWLVA